VIKNVASRLREGGFLLCTSETVDPHTRGTKELEGAELKTTKVVKSGTHGLTGNTTSSCSLSSEKRRLKEAPVDSNHL